MAGRKRDGQTGHAEWVDRARGVLKAEIKRRNLTYGELAERLRAMNIEETPENLSNKISRGKFTFVFALQCFAALDCRVLHLDA